MVKTGFVIMANLRSRFYDKAPRFAFVENEDDIHSAVTDAFYRKIWAFDRFHSVRPYVRAWPIALCARALPARNAGFGLCFKTRTPDR